MLKKCLAMLLCAAMLLSLTACLKDGRKKNDDDNALNFLPNAEKEESKDEFPQSVEPDVSYEDQIELIAANKWQWSVHPEEYAVPYSYAVTDLDQNGRLELIAAICVGTGIFTYIDVWQVNEAFNGIELCQTGYGEYDSQVDIITTDAKAYTDGECIYYIFYDWVRSGWAWNGEDKRAYSLCDGRITETTLAGYSCENFEDGSSVTTYRDVDGNEISEAEYEDFETDYFADLKELKATFLWQTYQEEDLEEMDRETLHDVLTASWEGFYVG